MVVINWCVDASFAVHGDYKSHTGATMTMGKGCPINVSSKQKINNRSSMEAELVGVNDAMAMVLWVRLFLEKNHQWLRLFPVVDTSFFLNRYGFLSTSYDLRMIEILQ